MSKRFNQLPENHKQSIHMCILRSDYMIDKNLFALKLVEYNTIASSMSSHCQRIREVQNYIQSKYRDQLQLNYTENLDDGLSKDNIPEMAAIFNRSVEHYLASMVKIHPESYLGIKTQDLYILFVIDQQERNICDQKWIECEAWERYGLRSFRMTLEDVGKHAQQDDTTKALRIHGKEIAFVYYRTGYQVEQYTSEADWATRELLEMSMPIKCPSIDVHLTTFKKFQ